MDEETYKKKVKEYLETKWTGAKACPICGQTTWRLADTMGRIPSLSGPNIILGGPYYPFIILVCSTCGYTILLNAKVVGLEAPEQPPQPATEGNQSEITKKENHE